MALLGKMVERRRDKSLAVRMMESELQMLSELAERENVSVSEWLRNTIRKEHLLAFGARPSPKPKK